MHRTSIVALLALISLSGLYGAPAAAQAKATPLLDQVLSDMPDKEVVMLTVEYAPGQPSPAHRHNAHTFVYVLEGAVLMGVKGKQPVKVAAGQTFYESPTDIHDVARNASETEPAKFLVVFVKNKGASTMAPAQ
jgi:quercetin dioxygenase-like cupin family protein